MNGESGAAALFEAFYISFMRNIFEDELGKELFEEFLVPGFVTNLAVERLWANRSSIWYDNTGSQDQRETFNDVVRKPQGCCSLVEYRDG